MLIITVEILLRPEPVSLHRQKEGVAPSTENERGGGTGC